MSKERHSIGRKSAAAAPAKRPTRKQAETVKGSINLRIEPTTRRLIDEAAGILGKTRTEFMVEIARSKAEDVLLDQRLFTLALDRYESLLEVLDISPAAGPKLRSLMRRVPAWER